MEYCVKKVGIKAIICGDKFRSHDFYGVLKELLPELDNNDSREINNANVPSLKTIITISKDSKR